MYVHCISADPSGRGHIRLFGFSCFGFTFPFFYFNFLTVYPLFLWSAHPSLRLPGGGGEGVRRQAASSSNKQQAAKRKQPATSDKQHAASGKGQTTGKCSIRLLVRVSSFAGREFGRVQKKSILKVFLHRIPYVNGIIRHRPSWLIEIKIPMSRIEKSGKQ